MHRSVGKKDHENLKIKIFYNHNLSWKINLNKKAVRIQILNKIKVKKQQLLNNPKLLSHYQCIYLLIQILPNFNYHDYQFYPILYF